MEITNLSKQQHFSEIMRQMLTQVQTAVHFFTNHQLPKFTLFPYTTLFRSGHGRGALRRTRHAPKWCVCGRDRKSTRLNSSHLGISYAVFCLKKKRFPRLCAKCLLKLKRMVSILPMTKSKK